MDEKLPFWTTFNFRHKARGERLQIKVRTVSQATISDAMTKIIEKFGKDYTLVV